MSFDKRIKKYVQDNFTGVMHTTMNPEGPGVVRIHLIPPKFDEDAVSSSVAIINGMDVIPVSPAWAVLLSEFISQLNRYSGRPISDEESEEILKFTCKGVRRVFPLLSRKKIKEDLFLIMKSFTDIARGKTPDAEVTYMSLGDYANCMQAPHRMDLMVSAMTKNGSWHCNQKCVHCYAAGQVNADEAELSTDQWKMIIDRCREACIPQLTFTGGEPTMRQDLIELITYAGWFVTRLNTNGIKLTPEYCRELAEASLDSIQITFYSDNKEVHNRLVGANRYDETVAGIENAIKAGLSVSINTPLCTLNRDYVKTLEFLHSKGVMYVTCSGLITTGNAATESSEALQLSEEEIKVILKEAVDYCYANEMEISFTSPGWVSAEYCEELGITSPTCGACLSNMAITPGGNVVPCQSWLSGDILGDLLTDDWETIWEQEICRSLRNYSGSLSGKCPLRRYC